MRATIAGVGLIALIVLGLGYLFDWSPPWRSSQSRHLLLAHEVTGSRQAGVATSFELIKERAVNPGEQGQRPILIEKGIVTNFEGGACIVFSADDLRTTQPSPANCTTDASCGTGGYCEPSAKRCWIKPVGLGERLCRKSRPEKIKWEVGKLNRIPNPETVISGSPAINLTPGNLPAERPVRVRTITCLEQSDGTVLNGCPANGPAKVYRWGPVKTL